MVGRGVAAPIVVGIGASAGGLDALQKLLPGLPANVGMAFVVVQHLAPKYHSLLPSLLAKYTDMPVVAISDGMLVLPDTIYITPPNTNVEFSGDRLILRAGPAIGPKPSIDTFLTSLAEEKMSHSAGIILSGTGSDGARGIRAIKSNEGITLAQTVESARFDSMPRAAIETGLVDLTLPPEKIGEGLTTVLKYPHLAARVPLDKHRDEIRVILDIVYQKTGVDFSEYKASTIHRRISRRMAILRLESPREYVDYIEHHPDEVMALSKDMLISVTSFFRDGGAFESLTKGLKELFGSKTRGDTFRAWVPGCSTGEEAYSIAILIAEVLGQDVRKYRFQIFATDIDDDSIKLARKAVYPVAAVADADQRLVEKYFTYHDDTTVSVNKEIRDMVVLARHDLIKDTSFMHLDLISCRNLLIYINPEFQEKLLSLFHFSLNPNGLLLLGKSESVGQRSDLFKTIDARWRLFGRKAAPARGVPELMQGRQLSMPAPARAGLKGNQGGCVLPEGDFFDSLLRMMDCCAVLTDEQGNIQYVRGDVSPYLKFPEGSVKDSFNALNMARPQLRPALQSIFYKTAKAGQTITSNAINFDKKRKWARIKVGPVQHGGADGYRLIAFIPTEASHPAERPGSTADPADERLHELEEELSFTREHLQDTIEELETSTEELQSLNEELQSANEELQATNEELETSNEELQASNEELNTVNDELRAKSDEAAHLLESLARSERRYRRLVDNMNEALMLCEIEYAPDRRPIDLIIRQANKALEELMNLKSRDLPLRAGVVQLHEMISAQLLGRFETIAKGGSPQRVELHLDALQKDVTLSVYNMGDDRLGIVCRDDTERKRVTGAFVASEGKYRELLKTANSIIIRWDNQGIIRYINEYGLRFFGYESEELIGHDVTTLVPKVEKSTGRDLDALARDIINHPEQYTYVPNENITKDGRTVWVAWTNKALLDEKGEVGEILAIGNDITALKQTEEALIKSEAEQSRQRRFLETLLDTTHACIAVMTGRELRYTLVNRAYQNLRPDMKMLGRRYREVFPDAVSAGAETLVRNVIATGVPQMDFGYLVSIPGKADATWDHQIVQMPADDDNQEASALIITWDSTEHSRAKEALRQSQEHIQASLAEKEILLKEIHHRVKNNMQVISSLVSLQTEAVSDGAIREILRDISHRVRSMAMVHEKLYHASDLSNLEFGDYARSLLNYLWRSYASQASGIQLLTELDPVALTVNTAVPCGLILNELVSNAIRHAFKGRQHGQLAVSLRSSVNDRIALRVKDNGVGLPTALDWRESSTLGLRLVQMLAKQIHASVEVIIEKGTEFIITFQRPGS